MNTKRQSVRRTRGDNAECVIASIKSFGVQPHPESRLMRMHRVLTEANGIIPPDHPEFETALEAERDLQVLAFVFEMADEHATDAEFGRLVRNALKDSLLPNDDRSNSRGRDAQFELFVGAVCQNAGLHPVAREQPDVTCHIEGIKFGIAVKRIKSIANLQKNVRKAAEQIEGTRLPGIIALETNLALNLDNQRITTPIPEMEFSTLYWQALKLRMTEYHDRIQELVRGKGVRGLVVHDQQVRFEPSGEWSLAGMTMSVNTARDNQRRNREFALFEKYYLRGLPNVEEVKHH